MTNLKMMETIRPMEKVKPMEPEEMRGNHKRPELRRNNKEARRGQGTPVESRKIRKDHLLGRKCKGSKKGRINALISE